MIKLTSRIRRTASDFSEIASKELELLTQHMPNLSDIDARTHALRMYYIELGKGISPINARSKVSKMFLISTTIVQRWLQSGRL